MQDPQMLLIGAVCLLCAAVVQGYFGFGFGMVAMASLTWSADLLHAAGVCNLGGIVLSVWMAWDQRKGILWSLSRRMLPPLVVGVLVGVTLLSSIDRSMMVRVLGVSIVAISLWNFFAPTLRSSESAALDRAIAFLGGVLGGAFNTGGPPLVAHLYRHPDEPDRLKATLQALFIAIGLSRLPIAMAQGLIDGAIWRDALLSIPVILAGVVAGDRLARRSDPTRFRRACWVGLALMGCALFASA